MKINTTFLKSRTCAILILALISTLNLRAQDYLISFTGTGASTTVDSVIVENLIQGTTLKMKGSEVLRLSVVTGIESMNEDKTGTIRFYPNPMKDQAKMQFILPEPGETIITMYDISGRKISQRNDFLDRGRHVYVIRGIEGGIYFANVTSGRYSCSGRLISSGSNNTVVEIIYENTFALQKKQYDSKGTTEEKTMQFNSGDRFLFKGISGIYSTVVTDIPTEGKTISFNFIPCTDGDGNHYSVVQIGSAKGSEENKAVQTWMAENLKTTKYRNGTAIPSIVDNTQWSQLISPGYCYFNNEEKRYKDVYGALYNWYTVNTGELCPQGWHVPSVPEWNELENYLIASGFNYDGSTQGSKVAKSLASTQGWFPSNNPGAVGNKDFPSKRNATGFTALPGGSRYADGLFLQVDKMGYLWTATAVDDNYAWNREFDHSNPGLPKFGYSKKKGQYVRCLKD